MSIRLYVGNLPKDTVERDTLQEMFGVFDPEVSTKVIKDRKTGKCRGFAFVTVPTDEVADQIIEKHNGQSFMDTTLKIEKALPREKTDSEKSEKEKPSGGANNSKPRNAKKQNTTKSSGGSGNSGGSNQPDPRWADDLAKLKEMLAAQATNS